MHVESKDIRDTVSALKKRGGRKTHMNRKSKNKTKRNKQTKKQYNEQNGDLQM